MKKHDGSKKMLIAFCNLIFLATISFAQSTTLTIDSCYAMARRNYPLIKQMSLVEKTMEYSIENANKNYLPQFSVNGQATMQSQVTELPIRIPGLAMSALSKDQYRIYGEINQPITDLFNVGNQKELIRATSELESQKVEIELYKLKERINGIYFGIILIDGQLRQTELLKDDIQTGIDKAQASINSGVALKSSVKILQAEMIKADQRSIELEANRRAYCEMLGLLISMPVDELTRLEMPATVAKKMTITRPEQKFYDVQKKAFETQKKLLNARNLPKAGLFLQAGYGRPALNMLSNIFESYYIGGLRLNWNITGFYTMKKEKKILTLNQNLADIQNETFLFNTTLSMAQQNREIEKYEDLISTDDDLVKLRESITTTAKEQLEFGTITANDYLTYINAEDQAKQNKILHQIQLVSAQYNYQTTSGN